MDLDVRCVRMRGMRPLGRWRDSGRASVSFVRSMWKLVVRFVGVLRRTPVKMEMSCVERFVRRCEWEDGRVMV